MSDNTNETYFIVRGTSDEEYLCPLNSIGIRDAITEDEMNDCVERDIVERYSGNIKIKPS